MRKRVTRAVGEDDLDSLVSLVADEGQLHPSVAAAFIGTTSYRGKEGIRRYIHDIREAFDVFHFKPLSFNACGDYLIWPTRFTGHGTACGVDIDLEMTSIWRVRESEVVWCATFFSRAEGLDAIGAAEEELEPIE